VAARILRDAPQAADTHRVAPAPRAGQAPVDTAHRSQAPALPAPGAGGDSPLPAPLDAGAREPRQPPRTAPPPARVAMAARAIRLRWPQTNLHVFHGDEAVSVWLRDSSLGEAEKRRLVLQLRAELSAAGLRLGSLMLNGELLFAGEPAQNDLTLEKRRTQWQFPQSVE
jgi:hypothetical protein